MLKTTNYRVDSTTFTTAVQFLSEMTVVPDQATKPCDPSEQQARQDTLDALYLLDRRDRPEHPFHALYTGLAQQYAAEGVA